MVRKRSKYSSEMAATRKIARKSHQLSFAGVFLLLYSNRFHFRATIDFSDRESSPDLSCSVEFGAECGDTTDREDSPSSIVLSDSEESPPKRRRRSRSNSRPLAVLLAYPASSLSGSCRQSNSSPIVGVLVDVVASNCCWHGQFESGHFSEGRSL